MKVYCVYDHQFELFSDPFLSADDASAERLIVQTGLLSVEFRKRLSFNSLYAIGSFESAIVCNKTPIHVFKRPVLVSRGERFVYLVEQCEKSQKAHLATVSASDSDVKEDSENE